MKLQADRSGFALPMSILLIGFMTAGVLAAFARTTTEVQLVDNETAATVAYANAERGLSQFLATGSISALNATYTYTNGNATVTATIMRDDPSPTGTDTWLIRSIGTATSPSGKPQARRTVAQLALRVPTTMQVVSSWTSLSGLHKNGAAGDITGFDACSGAAVAGVATPTGMLTGKDDAITGSPQHLEMGTQAQMASQIKIDWPGITNPAAPAISPDIVVCQSGTHGYDANWSPCGTWPTSAQWSNTAFWPTIVINGTSALPSNGRGTLIVTGDLTFGGGDQWDGIILVGGKITDNGSGNIAGAVVSGLNVLKGWTVGESSKANGTKDYTYDSCKVASATSALAKFQGMSNTWVDTWTW
jgi:hypothetical protein